jgi:hypothetical protein
MTCRSRPSDKGNRKIACHQETRLSRRLARTHDARMRHALDAEGGGRSSAISRMMSDIGAKALRRLNYRRERKWRGGEGFCALWYPRS